MLYFEVKATYVNGFSKGKNNNKMCDFYEYDIYKVNLYISSITPTEFNKTKFD